MNKNQNETMSTTAETVQLVGDACAFLRLIRAMVADVGDTAGAAYIKAVARSLNLSRNR